MSPNSYGLEGYVMCWGTRWHGGVWDGAEVKGRKPVDIKGGKFMIYELRFMRFLVPGQDFETRG